MNTSYAFSEMPPALQQQAGGKGGTLAFLFQKHYPVPEGVIIMPSAFNGDELTPEAWSELQSLLETIRKSYPRTAFSVRSSAIAEDSALASFAGEFETVLDVSSDEKIRAAINVVRMSRHSERVKTYSQAQGIEAVHEMAVVVQRMIQSGISGVLFTADPLTGTHSRVVGNYVHGLGEKLVSGEAEAEEFTIQVSKGKYEGPEELKRYHRRLFKLAKQLEKDLGCPQDIEWAVSENKVYILQSRPISTMMPHNPVTGEYNDSLTGDYVWTCVNYVEAIPEVMTPGTWALCRLVLDDNVSVPGCVWAGNIGGRFYYNVSTSVHIYNMFKSKKSLEGILRELMGMQISDDTNINQYIAPLPEVTFFPTWLQVCRIRLRLAARQRKTAEFVRNNLRWCNEMVRRIRGIDTGQELAALVINEVNPYLRETYSILLAAGERYTLHVNSLRRQMESFAGTEETNRLLTGISTPGEVLASLGPMAGLAGVASGEISREEYLEKWGHRIAGELEISIPRPFEEQDWLDRRLEEFNKSPYDIDAILAGKRSEFGEMWDRFQSKYPRKAGSIQKKLNRIAEDSRLREATRSEWVRALYIARLCYLRAGEMTGIDDDIFFLDLDELQALLTGKEVPLDYIPVRKQTYEKYKKLPPYPAIICGRFDPLKWAADPNRRTDIFDSHTPVSEPGEKRAGENIIHGMAGSAGVVEGLVRRLDSPEEGDKLKKGEILVASLTNIGWTLIFPRAGAVVTDIGAPLSHAAIVARELGIPAVVNCGNATTRLKTGDRVRVDGALGMVEILD